MPEPITIASVTAPIDGGSLAPAAGGGALSLAAPTSLGPAAGGLLDYFNPGAVPWVVALVVGTVLVVRVIVRALDRLSERLVGQRLLLKQLAALFAFVLYAVVGVVAFTSLFRLSAEGLLALSGTIALVVGFAFKDLATSFLAGITILTNKPFQVGDRITFGGYYGEVREIGLRAVRLVTLDDNLVTVPTSAFLTEPVASANAGELDCMVVISFFLAPATDHVRAREIVSDAVLASKYLYLGKPYRVLVATQLSSTGQAVVELRAKAYVFDARHERAFSSDVTDRVLRRFKDEQLQLAGA